MIRKLNSFIADVEKLLVIWIEDQTSYNIPLNQGQSKALILFNSMKAERGDEAEEENFQAGRGWFTAFQKEAIYITEKCQVKQQVM